MICPICATLISESRNMKRHLRTHQSVKSFKVCTHSYSYAVLFEIRQFWYPIIFSAIFVSLHFASDFSWLVILTNTMKMKFKIKINY
jgi:hypothetical protein